MRPTGLDGIDFDGPQITGDFTNNANFNLNGNYVDAIGIDDDSVKGVIGGSFVNNGTITANGYNASGINIADTEIGVDGGNDSNGNVVNNGTINVIDQSGTAPTEEQAAIMLENVRLHGDLINKGTVNVTATNAWGIKVDGQDQNPLDTFKYARIDRDVTNDGTINVAGASARGIELNNVNFGQDVENHGTINASGANATALRMDRTDYNRIINTGTINAAGSHSVGIEVRESFGNTVLNHAASTTTGQDPQYLMQNGIINEGTVKADGVGIKITNDLVKTGPGETSNVDNFYRITQNKGTISGGEAAIDGNGQANLYLNGGTIIGNIEGIRAAFVNGNVAISSKLIEANSLEVATGNLYVAEVTNVTGDMIIRNGAGVSLFVNNATDPNKAIAAVAGKLTLEQGSVVGVTTNPGSFNKATTKYVLLSAGELVNLGAQVKTLTPLLAVTNVAVENNSLTANIGLASGDQAGNGLSAIGIDRNGLAASKAFIDGVLSKLPPNSNLYQTFINANDAQLRRLATQLQPETNRAAQTASLSATGLAASAIGNRAASVGANSGDALIETGAWVKVLHGNSDQGSRGGIAGYDANSNGLIIGADGKLNEQTTLGLAFSHVRTDVSGDNGNDTDVTTNLLSGYGSWEQGPYSVLGTLSVGKGDNESKRYVAGERAKGDYDSTVLAADLSAGYTIKLNDNLNVIPTVATRYSKVKIDSFTEKGTDAALRSGSQSLEVFDLGGGVKLEGQYGNFKPTARLMAFHDFAQDNANSTSSFSLGGNTFVTTGAPATKWTYETGVGLDWTKGNYTVGASYDYTRKADFNADTFTLKARYDW
ncbi:autotransporter outer membrane beta-barrel domain-containing protein [Pseudomonas sp. P108]|uniref:autotransporter family protein n=1 Tax=Pseudomonas sp. P108 TaxID=1837993 RepID=UPI00293424B4|nr:autotransporter outer membrane beta-barrel domain-containing protein [Pseudomonas sp. P108]WNZ87461.1 autotransporter outer membrane beta-barrel domain-containing protein [Pseudomonas sp. P108]